MSSVHSCQCLEGQFDREFKNNNFFSQKAKAKNFDNDKNSKHMTKTKRLLPKNVLMKSIGQGCEHFLSLILISRAIVSKMGKPK